MELNERLQICLLALANRYPQHAVDINEVVLGPQSYKASGWTALELIEQLQRAWPNLLETQARLVLNSQKCEIYLTDFSGELPAFHIHCRGRVLCPSGEVVILPVEEPQGL